MIRILDFAFVRKDADGTVTGMELTDFDGDGRLDLAVFEGVGSGLLGADDLDEAAAVLEPGNSAGVLVYENTWAAPFATALRRGGARVVASGRVPLPDLLRSLDDLEGIAGADPSDGSAPGASVTG